MKPRLALACALLAGCAAAPEVEESSLPAPDAPAARSAPLAEPAARDVPPVAPAPARVQPPALDAQPAAVPMPPAPPPQKPARDAHGEAKDSSGELTRNGHVVGRLPEAGLRASFPFEAEAGEQSLFELAGSGFSRGGGGRVRISIEDSNGKTAWQSERDVGVTWRDFAAFTPERSGTWTYSLTILEGGYRFVLVRHSSYPPLGEQPLDLGDRTSVHGHLPNAEAVASFRVPVSAGEQLALKLTPTRDEAREEARRGATEMGAMVTRMEMQPMGGRMAGGGKLLFQRFDLEVLADGVPLGRPASYVRFQAPRSGAVEVRVRARYAAGGGGLFDLAVERPLQLLRVHGVVVDAEDLPMRDVEISFLREPDADLVGTARSNAEGEYEATVLAGDLAIQMLRGQVAAEETVRVRVTADTALDLGFQPGAKLRGR